MGEPGFELLRASSAVPEVGQIAGTVVLPPSRIFARDPIASASQPDRYAFIANNPINLRDYLGLLDTGKIHVTANNPSGSDGWNVRFEWFPP